MAHRSISKAQHPKTQRPKVSPARVAAYQVLLRVETRNSFAAELLHSDLLQELSHLDRALTTEIVMGTLRWQSSLDSRLSATSGRAISKLDPEVRVALRLAAYQLLYLNRIPPRAAVNEGVELVKLARKRSAVPFANAVLRKLLPTDKPGSVAGSPDSLTLAQRYAHPEWLVQRWIDRFGLERTEQICRFDQERPIPALRIHSPAIEAQLKEEGIVLSEGALLASARRVLSGDVTNSQAWRRHQVFIQDEASQLVALLLGWGKRVLDCCAAPGGKAAVLALQNPGSTVIASELHVHRARKMRELLAGSQIQVVAADARRLPFDIFFDRVLADLPCSGTGTLARNPEIKWKLTPHDLVNLQSRQHQILVSALQQVAPGGRLLYSTCSLEPEEGESVVEAVLQQHTDLHVVPIDAELLRLRREGELIWPDLNSMIAGRYLRITPGVHPCDGFFAALLERQ